MPRNSRRTPRWCVRWLSVGVLLSSVGCGASPIGGPDPARATFFKATMINGGPLPYSFKINPLDLTPLFIVDARLVPLDLGRTTDTRIFEDRGGSGNNGGNGRDTTVSTGRMTDIRVFASNGSGANTQVDSIVVDVVRVGDVLYITRQFPNTAQNSTDTANYENGVLVRPLRYWRNIGEPPTGRLLTYTTVR